MPAEAFGDRVHGELNSADASSGVEIVLYAQGTTTVRVIGANERLEIHSLKIVSVPGGDCTVLVGADATPAAGERADRGTYAANGGFAGKLEPPYVGLIGGKPFVIAPAGVVDVFIKGTIR